ncbi:hypothetical protein ACOAJ8_04615 [Arcobacter cryaerophilus gv. pseudocryaerophilus]
MQTYLHLQLKKLQQTQIVALNNSLEKLSTGLKINKASDDASGLAIADKLKNSSYIYKPRYCKW